MRRDKTVARILLIFSVANVALAAPAAVRQRHLDESAIAARAVPEPAVEAPKASKFLSAAAKSKIKLFSAAAAILIASGGILYGTKKLQERAYVSAFFPPSPCGYTPHLTESYNDIVDRDFESTGVVDRDAASSLHGHPDHPQPVQKTVSRGSVNLREEDLRLLNILTRSALESLV